MDLLVLLMLMLMLLGRGLVLVLVLVMLLGRGLLLLREGGVLLLSLGEASGGEGVKVALAPGLEEGHDVRHRLDHVAEALEAIDPERGRGGGLRREKGGAGERHGD